MTISEPRLSKCILISGEEEEPGESEAAVINMNTDANEKASFIRRESKATEKLISSIIFGYWRQRSSLGIIT